MATQAPVAAIGIDVGKETLVVSGLSTANVSLRTRSFPNSKNGVRRLASHLNAQGTASTVPCVIEATGDYHLLSAIMLASEGYLVNCINPLITKRYRLATIRNAKTDSLDAVQLAEIGLREPNLARFVPNLERIADKKRLSVCAKLEHTIQVLTAHVESVEQTSHTLGFKVDLRSLKRALKLLEQQRRQLAAEVAAHAEQLALELADVTPGLSREAVSVVETMLSDKQFTTKDALVAFCGLDIAARRSGKWKGTERLSKKGNSYLRKKLFLVAWGLFMHNPEYRAYYDQLAARGIPYIARLNALARRFLRTTWWHHLQKSNEAAVPVSVVLPSDVLVSVV